MTYCARPVPNPVAGFFFARVFRIVAPSRLRYTLAAFSDRRAPRRSHDPQRSAYSFRWLYFLPPTYRIPLLSGPSRGMHVMTAPRAS